jgi:hypothetical protein
MTRRDRDDVRRLVRAVPVRVDGRVGPRDDRDRGPDRVPVRGEEGMGELVAVRHRDRHAATDVATPVRLLGAEQHRHVVGHADMKARDRRRERCREDRLWRARALDHHALDARRLRASDPDAEHVRLAVAHDARAVASGGLFTSERWSRRAPARCWRKQRALGRRHALVAAVAANREHVERWLRSDLCIGGRSTLSSAADVRTPTEPKTSGLPRFVAASGLVLISARKRHRSPRCRPKGPLTSALRRA